MRMSGVVNIDMIVSRQLDLLLAGTNYYSQWFVRFCKDLFIFSEIVVRIT